LSPIPEEKFFGGRERFSNYPVFPSGKKKVFMKRSLAQWWNSTERGKPKC
jgi:hypothetical protein